MSMKTFLGTTICPLVQHVVATFQAIENKLSHAIHYQKNTVANQNTKQLLKSQYRVLLDNGFLNKYNYLYVTYDCHSTQVIYLVVQAKMYVKASHSNRGVKNWDK